MAGCNAIAVKTLFGGDDRPWDLTEWTASDDSVRGGKSWSRLVPLSDKEPIVRLEGNLDITTLGGAGFASQRTVDGFPSFDLSAGYDAIVLDIPGAFDKEFAFILKDNVLPKGPDGRDQSTLSWEYSFSDPHGAAASGPRRLVLPLEDFQPFYRGRLVEDAKPLDLANVKRVQIMCRSYFGKQSGDFSLPIRSIVAAKTKNHDGREHSPAPSSVTLAVHDKKASQADEKAEGLAKEANVDRGAGRAASNGWKDWLARLCWSG